MIKSRTMVAGVLATALGFASTAQAQGWQPQQDQRERDYGHQHQYQSQPRTSPQWQAHRQWQGQPQWQGHSQWQGQRQYAPQHQARTWGGYGYRDGYRGGYVAYAHPHHYRAYDWRARHLAAPPHGYGWVEDDSGDVLLMALATGLIANAIVNSAAQPAPYYQAPPPYYQQPAQPQYYPSPDYPY
jgi:Ni/Co efflux regulator RcnB